MTLSTASIVIIDDDGATCEMMTALFTSLRGYQMYCFSNGEEALEQKAALIAMQPALFIIDYHLPRMTGFDLYDQLHALCDLRHTSFLLITAYPQQHVYQARGTRHLSIIEKPFELDVLLSLVDQLIQESQERREEDFSKTH